MFEDNLISRSVFNKTFPFFFTVDYQLVIRDAGKSLLKVRKDIIQKSLLDVFEVVRPAVFDMSFKSLCESENKVFLLSFNHLQDEVLFKAQVIILEKQRRVLFVGSPFLRELDELPLLNLSLNDFSISDSTVDMLQILQVNKMVNDDMQELNRRLKIKEEKYRGLIEEAKEIIFTTDLNGNFTYMNEVGIKAVGLSEEDVLSSSFSDLMDKQYVEKIKELGLQLMNKELDVAYVEFPLKSQSEFWIGQNMTLVNAGEVQNGFQGVGRDITEKINYEKVIVGEKEKAQIAAKEKSRFLANMSHEIRTPLNGIMGLTNLLLDTEISEKQKKYLSAITSSSETLMVVINDILDISKIDAGKLKIGAHSFSLKTCIAQLVEMLSVKAAEKGVKLQYLTDGQIPDFLMGDEPRLNQILYNVVGNALKFTQEGTVKINVTCSEVKDQLVNVEIKVQDTGIGIHPDKLKHIFKAFGQVDENDTREFQGTGLGLTIASKLIGLHHGTIGVESEEGVGSTFTIVLPYKVFEEEDSEGRMDSPKLNSTDYNFKGIRVLLAEDNPVNQMVTKDLLVNKNSFVEVAENGQVALDKLESGEYDIVLMDMQMPVMDGYAAMQEIGRNLNLKALPILALTAHVSAEERSKCIKNGASDYLSKPFKPSELFEKIQNLVPNADFKKVLDLVEEGAETSLDDLDHLDKDVFDFSKLHEFTNGNKNIIVSTLGLLKTVLPNDIKELKKGAVSQDFEKVRAVAHRSVPNFKLVFKDDYASLLMSLESLAESCDNHERILQIVSDLENKQSQVLEAIDKELLTFQ